MAKKTFGTSIDERIIQDFKVACAQNNIRVRSAMAIKTMSRTLIFIYIGFIAVTSYRLFLIYHSKLYFGRLLDYENI